MIGDPQLKEAVCLGLSLFTLASLELANGIPVMTTALPALSEKSSPSLTLPLQLPGM